MPAWYSLFSPARAAIAAAAPSNEQYKPKSRPVGLFLGGTSGIGRAMAEQLAKQTNGRAQIILLGRNQEAADQIIDSFPRTEEGTSPAEESRYSFVKVDATSMAEIRNVTARLSNELDKVNFIVASTAFFSIKGRNETSEGIDRKMACSFYGRFRFIYELAPLLGKASENGEQTGVLSVYAAGRGSAIDMNDLGLAKGFNLKKARDHAATYNDAALEELAIQFPKVPFNHIFPGIVSTPALNKWTAGGLLLPLFSFITITPEECAQVMWWRMWSLEPQWKSGSHQISQHGEELQHNPDHVTPEVRKAVWDHAVAITGGVTWSSSQPKSSE